MCPCFGDAHTLGAWDHAGRLGTARRAVLGRLLGLGWSTGAALRAVLQSRSGPGTTGLVGRRRCSATRCAWFYPERLGALGKMLVAGRVLKSKLGSENQVGALFYTLT